MNQGSSKMAVRALIVGGVAVVALVTAARRCDQPTREPVQENVAASSAPAPQPVPAARLARLRWCLPAPAPHQHPRLHSTRPSSWRGFAASRTAMPLLPSSSRAMAIAAFLTARTPRSGHSILIHALANAEQLLRGARRSRADGEPLPRLRMGARGRALYRGSPASQSPAQRRRRGRVLLVNPPT
jgi:hypothetical protein